MTAGYGTWILPEVQFYIGYDVIRNGQMGLRRRGAVLDARRGRRASSRSTALGRVLPPLDAYAVRIGYGWNYSNWQLELFNGQGLDFCRV